MKYKNMIFTSAVAFVMGATTMFVTPDVAHANCGISSGRVSIVGNEFPAIHSVAKKAQECAVGGVTIKANLTADHKEVNLPGMQANPAEYTTAIIANSSLVPLMNEGVVRPLNDLVAKYGGAIPDYQKVKVGNDIMAIAFMANAQHLIYRDDVLKKVGASVPASYEEVLAAAKKIRDQGIMQYPLSGAYKAGWNLAQEFVNMYIGHGGEFYVPGTPKVAVNNAQGVATLKMMKALTDYMNPDYLTHDSNAAAAEWEAGNVAIMNFWGSRSAVLMDDEGSAREVYSNTKVGGPLMVGNSGVPATTLWWDGWTVAKNVSDEDATATFLAMLNGVSPELLNKQTMGQAVWMIRGYKPAPVNEGVFRVIGSGAKPYPMLPYHGLLHTALGNNIADFLQGKESAEKTLADVEAAYNTAAREKGFIN